MKGIVLKIVCYVAVLASFGTWPESSASTTPLYTPFTLPPSTTFSPKGTPCDGVRCTSGRFCALDENNKATCVCAGNCNDITNYPVCGSDNKTYENNCAVTRKACMTNSNLTVNYYGECRYEGSICNGIDCSPNKVCAVAGNRAICICNDNCPTYSSPVCGSDNQTYINDCYLRRQSCLTNKTIWTANYSECKQESACDGFSCPNGTQCAIDDRKRPVCVCLNQCPYATEEVCGTDGRTYGSECELYKQACTTATSIRVASKGYCLNGSVCSGFRCPTNKLCNVNQDNKPVCVCKQSCASNYDPVCGSDGVTYPNLCSLERQACTTGTNITMERKDQCSYSTIQYPRTCVVDAKNQTSCVCNNNCGNLYSPICGSDNKTYDNYCQFIYAACQRNLSTNSYSGVCSEGSGCQGIYCPAGQHCDSVQQSQPKCVCNTVCSKTSSPLCGSNNKTYNNYCELQKDACLTNTSIWTRFSGRCEDGPGCKYNNCPYGRVCVVDERNQPMCVCSLSCSAASSEVCGSDGKTYSGDCFLRAAACLTNKTIFVQQYEPCKRVGPCSGFVCSPDRYCQVGQNGKPNCVCNDQCNSYGSATVCGSDNKTYSGLCALQRKACFSSSSIRWLYYGACAEASVCDKISCPPDKRCVVDERNRPTCVCFDQCGYVQNLVCGSDGRTYNNDCEMQKAACLSNRNVTMKYRGKCDKGLTCSDISCPTGRVCALNEKNQPTCVCNTVCYSYFFLSPVCGTDGKTYASICHIQREACTKNKNIQMNYSGSCMSDANPTSTTSKRPCFGPSCTTSSSTTTTTTLTP